MTEFLNCCTIEAQLLEKEILRFTPAGIPVSTAIFRYEGTVNENDKPRALDFEFNAVAVGETGNVLDGCKLLQKFRLFGFLAPKTKRSRHWMLHIQKIEKLED